MENVKTILITQARTGSTRLPGKVLLEVKEKSLLEIHLIRLSSAKLVDQIIVATTTNSEDDVIEELCSQLEFSCVRGSETNVLDRFYQAVKDIKATWVVRVTSDCPLIDAALVDAVISCAIVNDVDYCSNTLLERFPDGQDIEVFKYSVLEQAWKEATLASEKEHVTPYIRNNANDKGKQLFKAVNFPCVADFSKIRMTVDEKSDFELISTLIDRQGFDKSWLAYTHGIINENLSGINDDIVRNEGLLKSLKND